MDQYSHPGPEVKPRGKPSEDGRFIWLSSLAIERIVNELGATQAAYGIAVYVALARLSSQAKNVAAVEATVQKIAGMARISYPKAFYTLDALADVARVISIERGQRQKGDVTQKPNRYTLLSCKVNRVKSGKLNTAKSADLTEVAIPYSEIPKETPLKGELERETVPATVGSALGEQPTGSTVSRKITWDAEGEP